MSSTPTDRGDATLVIGAGPAGLATARALAARGLPYDQVERNEGVGGIWDIDAPGSPMYEAAHFISSRTLSGFPGFPMGADLPDYPDHRQVLGYLRDFAAAYRLGGRVETGRSVSSVQAEGGRYLVTLDGGEQRSYAAVVCCSGAQWTPRMPEIPEAFTGEVVHSKEYRDLEQLRGRRVLVIGGGNSACDIVVDAARAAERAVISMRRGYWFIPKHVFGVPSDVFAARGPHLPKRIEQALFGFVLTKLYGKPERLGLPKPDHRVFETHPVLNSNLFLALQHGDVVPRPGIADMAGTTVTFTDGSTEDVDLVIAATGYRHTIPYAQDLFGGGEHPDLYLTACSREHEGLFGIGFTETNSGAYGHFDGLAQIVAAHLADRRDDPAAYAKFRSMVRHERPDLSGGIRFDDSPRHAGYVDADALTAFRREVMGRMAWRPQHGTPAPALTPVPA
jgi:cation diffusion facilitator CzcD-associated flavoprotein CzcO